MSELKNSLKNIFEAYALIKPSGVINWLSDAQLVRVLLYCESKNWLFYRYENDKMVFVACAYHIPKFDNDTCNVIPAESVGTILYIPFVVSIASDKTLPRKVMAEFLEKNPHTEQIVFHKDDSGIPTILKRRGEADGEKQNSRPTVNTDLSARPTVQGIA
jgi:hypothetical protein